VRSVGPALHMLRAWAGPWLALCGGRAAHTGCATAPGKDLPMHAAWKPTQGVPLCRAQGLAHCKPHLRGTHP